MLNYGHFLIHRESPRSSRPNSYTAPRVNIFRTPTCSLDEATIFIQLLFPLSLPPLGNQYKIILIPSRRKHQSLLKQNPKYFLSDWCAELRKQAQNLKALELGKLMHLRTPGGHAFDCPIHSISQWP